MKIILSLFILFLPICGHAQSLQKQLVDWASNYARTDANIKPSTVVSCVVDDEKRSINIVMGGGFQEQHFTPTVVERIYNELRAFVPSAQKNYELTVETDGRPIEELVPNFFKKGKKDTTRMYNNDTYEGRPWVYNLSRPFIADKGLEGIHIALWQSHGRYYKTDKDDWYWQRPRLFCTTEDLLSQTFVTPYIIPMLQNAGAVVFTPRERDYQTHEVIVDNDHPNRQGTYLESCRSKNKHNKWQTTGTAAFAHNKDIYSPCDSPFTDGTARYIPTVTSKKNECKALWVPHIPEEGRYAVYVAYQSLPNSVDDATYTVYHKGGFTEYKVNQRMGGGTWVYLGTFDFDQGEHDYGMVTLSNLSDHKGVVTADAVRFGGGMGNITPTMPPTQQNLSGLPRWAEAAKYSVQWYGFPYRIHTEPFGNDDYNNDINARSAAINHLIGGTIHNPEYTQGLHVPLDLSIGFHTDAGVKPDDALVGSLGIYMTNYNDGKTGAGLDRYVSRDLASMFLTNLSTDLQSYHWAVRQLWNRNYGEARVPLTPACILEMLSHQNFADMRLAYNPRFQFDFSRSVYKTIVKYIATLHRQSYAIQPLPPTAFAIALNENKSTATLSWMPVEDPLEPTAKPREYIVYTRRGHFGFDNGTLVKGTTHTVKLSPDEVYSFRVTAVNEGGESFPTETLACGIASRNQGTVMVVNAFTRLEGPKAIDTPTQAGFDLNDDPGVPYGAYTGFCGLQYQYDRSKAGREGSDALGASGNELEGRIFMGNTFDYPLLHGHAIMLTGQHSFTSCSEQALLQGKATLHPYPIVDLIYGTQQQFDHRTTALIKQYYKDGGRLLLSASHAEMPNIGGNVTGQIADKSINTISGCGLTFHIHRDINSQSFCVPHPAILSPDAQSFAILTYSDGTCAAVAQEGRLVQLAFPLEAITTRKDFNSLTQAFIRFLTPNSK